jgi:hypothetical protein
MYRFLGRVVIMKVAVIKLGARIQFGSSGSTGSVGEAVSICNMLTRCCVDVHVFTKILNRDESAPVGITLHQIEDEWESTCNFDALIIINGTVQFYGGVLDHPQILNYHILNNFKGPVFYILCDPAIILKQIWSSVESKDKDSLYKRENIEITRTDIHYISQPYNTAKYLEFINKAKNSINISKIDHYPFEKFPCLQSQLAVNPMPIIDLSYGGTFRGGRRADKLVKFYFGYSEELDVEIFGKIDIEDFEEKKIIGLNRPGFTGPVKYEQMLNKMNKSIAHVVIGDKLYEDTDDVPQRTSESVWSQVVTFIDSDMDKARRIFGHDPELREFLYVKDRKEVEDRIQMIKNNDDEFRREILKAQIKAFDFDADGFCKGFVDLLNVGM